MAQEVDMPQLTVKVLYVADEISNATVATRLSDFGKVSRVEREMYKDWPEVEAGVRIATMTDLRQGIPRRLHTGPYPIETRYCGQIPQCNHCGEFGHRVATCVNEVKCFRCGEYGHVRRECYKCFLCGNFGHIRANCPENPLNKAKASDKTETAIKGKESDDEFSDPELDVRDTDTSMKGEESEDPEREDSQKGNDPGDGEEHSREMDLSADPLKRSNPPANNGGGQAVDSDGFIRVSRRKKAKTKKMTL